MNIDDLKSNWNSLDFPPEYSHEATREMVSRVEQGRVATLRDRLSSISRRLSAVSFASMLCMVPFFHDFPTLVVLTDLFFIFAGVMHLRAYFRVSSLDFSRMTVREAINSVCMIERDRVRRRALCMALGIPLVAYMIFTFTSTYGEFFLYGCISGAVLGLIIGLAVNRRAVAIIREMRSQLNPDEQ